MTPWTVACQAPLESSRQEYWSGLPFPPPGDLPSPGIKHTSPASPELADRFFTTEPTWKPLPFQKLLGQFLPLKLPIYLPPHPLNGFLRLSLLRRPPVLPLDCQSGSTSRNHLWAQFSPVTQSYPTLCDPWTAACQASLSITNSRSLLTLRSIHSVIPCNHLILCQPLFLLPSIFPSTRVFSNESVLCISWPRYWNF